MKYYSEMRNIEDEVIKLDYVESLLRIMGNSEFDESDVKNAIWHLESLISDINKNMSSEFYLLWDSIRSDSCSKQTTENTESDFEKHLRFQHILEPFTPKED
jgi:hypothetical protein